jgi:flagellar biosynthesis/type III secretory pathway protein FliH
VKFDATRAFPHLTERWPGVWCGRDSSHGGLVVLDISRMPEQKGWAYWRLTSQAMTAEERARRVEALRTDRHLPKQERVALTEAIAMRMIPTTPEEKTAAVKSLRKEAYRLGKTDGKAEGRRQALLAVVAILAPDVLERLERVEDVAALEREVAELIRGRLS